MTHPSFAVVTGASSGIGLELAKQLARNGFDVLMTAEDAELAAAAAEVRALGGSVVELVADLATFAGVEAVAQEVLAVGRPVDALALNAGRGAGGAFVGHDGLKEAPLAMELEVIDLNCRSTVHLAKLLLPAMVTRGEGRVLVTSSIASTMPGPFQAVYNASKSFTQSFALALRQELQDTGVTVTTLMPGPTDTDFFAEGDLLDTKLGQGPKDAAELVARQGFEAMMAGDERVEAGGLKSKLQGRFSRILPDAVKGKAHAKLAEPGSAPREG